MRKPSGPQQAPHTRIRFRGLDVALQGATSPSEHFLPLRGLVRSNLNPKPSAAHPGERPWRRPDHVTRNVALFCFPLLATAYPVEETRDTRRLVS